MPLGSLAKAASVGAKTVNGPLPRSVSVRPAASMAAVRVLKLPAAAATPTMSPLSAGLTVSAGCSVLAGCSWAMPAVDAAAAMSRTARTSSRWVFILVSRGSC